MEYEYMLMFLLDKEMEKALRYGSDEPFWMNYQQIKVDMADVFIFIGVWIERIVYWVMSKEEIKKNKYL
ncbi:MAG: hypothetical protein AB1397_03050 [bacterium]